LPSGAICQAGKGYCQDGKCIAGKPPTKVTTDASAGPDASTVARPNRVTPGHICERLATIQCVGEATCCTTPSKKFATFDECKTSMKSFCTDSLYIDRISQEPTIGFDVDAGEAAFDAYELKASQCDPNIVSWGTSMNGFRSMLKGTIAAGGDCTPSNVLDVEKDGAALFACKDAPTYACLPPPSVVGVTWTCEKPRGAGESCFWEANCLDGLWCEDLDGVPGDGVCRDRKELNAGCTTSNECKSLACSGGKCIPADAQTAYCLKT
jgi:hypothetical protein